MSWFSQFIDDPVNFVEDNPWKTLGLLAAPVAAFAAPWALPELGAIGGIGAAGAAEGLGAAGLGAAEGLGAAGVGEGALAGASLEGLAGGAAGGTAASEGLLGGLGLSGVGGEAGGLGSSALGFSGEAAPGMGGDLASWLGAPGGAGGDAVDAFASAADAGGAAPSGEYGAIPDEFNYTGQAPASGDASGIAGKGAGESPGVMSNLWDKLSNDPLKAAGVGVAGLGLGYNMLSGANKSPNVEAMTASAGAQSAQAKQLMSYLQQGKLPPGLEGIAKTMQQSMDAQAVANAAKSGMPTDPTQNTSLMNQLSANKERVFGWIAQQGVQLLNSGITLSGLSNQLYAQLEQLDRQKSQQTGQAIANFAAALNGGGRGTYMKVA